MFADVESAPPRSTPPISRPCRRDSHLTRGGRCALPPKEPTRILTLTLTRPVFPPTHVMATLPAKKRPTRRLKYLFLPLLLPLALLRPPRYTPLLVPSLPLSSSEPYDLPSLLSVPSYTRPTPPDLPARAARLAHAYPTSLLARLLSVPAAPACAARPHPPHLRAALSAWRAARRPVQHEALVRRNDTLVVLVHAEPRRTEVDAPFLRQVRHRAALFRTVLLVVCVAHGGDVSHARRDVAAVREALRGERLRIVLHSTRQVDEDVFLFHAARNLMVHRGDMAALAALVCDGTVFYTDALDEYLKQNQFKWMLKDGRPAVDPEETVPTQMWRAMGPVQPTCCNFEGFGHGDGEKIVCANSKTFASNACWILSLGCQGKWSFERDIVKRTNCKIHTFDCTGTWPVPAELQGRVTLHKTCLGKDDDPREDFVGWNRVIAMGATKGARKMPALVKMDIEGYEFPVLQALLDRGHESVLPQQLAIEMHAYKATPVFMSQLFDNFTRRGYSLVHRADNPWCAHCTEITVNRNMDLPDVVANRHTDV